MCHTQTNDGHAAHDYQSKVRFYAEYHIKLHNPLIGKRTARFFEFQPIGYTTQASQKFIDEIFLYLSNRLLGYLIPLAICDLVFLDIQKCGILNNIVGFNLFIISCILVN